MTLSMLGGLLGSLLLPVLFGCAGSGSKPDATPPLPDATSADAATSDLAAPGDALPRFDGHGDRALPTDAGLDSDAGDRRDAGPQPGFTLSCSPGDLGLGWSGHAEVKCQLSTELASPVTVALACPRPPAGVECAFSPASVDLQSKGSTSVALTVGYGLAVPAGGSTLEVVATATSAPGAAGNGGEARTTLKLTKTVDTVLARCPSSADLDAVDAEIPLSFEGDPSAGTLVCSAAQGSRDLTRLQERVYQALLMMKRMTFDAPLLWTSEALYAWWLGTIVGVRFRDDIDRSFCCAPARVINIQTSNSGVLSQSTRWLNPQTGTGMPGLIALLVHEARHSDGYPHTCGTNDNTIAELGAWAVQYYFNLWLADHSDPAFLDAGPPSPGYYRDSARASARNLCSGPTNRFCHDSCP